MLEALVKVRRWFGAHGGPRGGFAHHGLVTIRIVEE